MAYDASRGISGAGAGATAGSAIFPGVGTAIGGLAGALSGFFGNKNKNPADAAMGDLNKIEGKVTPQYQPYINAGQNAMPGYQDIMHQLLSNPQEFMKMLGGGYQESPGYQWKKNQGLGAINNASAAGGMLGTPQHEQEAGELAGHLADQDFNEYMDRVLKGLGMGAAGTEGIINRGQTASSSLADKLAEILGTKAQYKYAGQAAENQGNAADQSNMFSGLGMLDNFFGKK